MNLAPTGLPKSGSALDLAVAVGVAATRTEIPVEVLERTLFLGELGLDGGLRPVRGTLALLAAAAGLEQAVVPLASLREAALCGQPRVYGGRDLGQVICFLRGEAALELAEQGHKVTLVEKQASIGGIMAQLDKTYPTMDCSI